MFQNAVIAQRHEFALVARAHNVDKGCVHVLAAVGSVVLIVSHTRDSPTC